MSEKVVIIGGGLTGLSAAWELEKQHVPYTLIEVKGRLGGSIISERRDGFVFDGGPMTFEPSGDWSFLEELGLSDALFETGDFRRSVKAFKDGTQTLTDALASKLTDTVMLRMAVTSLGYVGGQFAVCFENGLALTAGALIVAAPALTAERMFRTLQPDIALRLFDWRYETVARITALLGWASTSEVYNFKFDIRSLAFFDGTDSRWRMPSAHALTQVGIPFEPAAGPPTREQAAVMFGKPIDKIARVDYWPTEHLVGRDSAEHTEDMRAIESLMPEGVALVGSDYLTGETFVPMLAERVATGLSAAQKVAKWLGV